MNHSEKSAFAKLVTDVLAYYRQDTSDFTLNVWWSACQPFDMEQVSKAMTAHATDPEHGVFAPKVADIVRILIGTQTDRATLAWGKVLEAMGSVGAYSDVVFDDPAIHAAIDDLGGWPKTCRTDLKDLSFLQHRFCLAHKAYTGRGEFEFPRCLMGDRSPDNMYEKRGLKPPRPAVVGDVQKAKLVYQGGNQGGKTEITFQSLQSLAGDMKALEAA